MKSLLGQFYHRIKGSQEDIASEGLTYILKKSVRARKAIDQMVRLSTGLEFSDLSYRTQAVGDELERPDISGIDEDGQEVLLIEAKFWSSLTKNQPNAYLKRLCENSVLIFLVPSLRVRVVYEEVLRKMAEEYPDVEADPKTQKIKVSQSNKFVIVKSWDEILNAIKSALLQEGNSALVSDIDQIIGFCEAVDSSSFQPISASDLSPDIARKINSYYDVVDKVVDELKNRMAGVSTEGAQKTPQRYGYRRYFSIRNLGLAMCLEMKFWEKHADTPFWLLLVEDKKAWASSSSEKFKRDCEKVAFKLKRKFLEEEKGRGVFFSLNPKIEVTEDVLIHDLADQVELIYGEVRRVVG